MPEVARPSRVLLRGSVAAMATFVRALSSRFDGDGAAAALQGRECASGCGLWTAKEGPRSPAQWSGGAPAQRPGPGTHALQATAVRWKAAQWNGLPTTKHRFARLEPRSRSPALHLRSPPVPWFEPSRPFMSVPRQTPDAPSDTIVTTHCRARRGLIAKHYPPARYDSSAMC